ncbi:MAG: hydroxyacid dehydrogenase [Oscillospiraceae bacterium]|nr:hydroxyacid dehydrogenase [Oscillospiraceae bacterium]
MLLTEKIHDAGIQLLKRHGCDVTVLDSVDEEKILAAVADQEGLLTRTGQIGARVMDAAPMLKVISMHGVGVDGIDVEEATRRGIWVTNAPGANSVSVAEYAMCQLLMLAKKSVEYNDRLHAGDWGARHSVIGIDLENRTLGVVGSGRIGMLVARKASMGFGMNVLVYKRKPKDGLPLEGVRYTDSLKEIMSQSDFVTLHVPLNNQTAGLISRELLGLMKPTAFLLNTARGEVVDEAALIELLQTGKLAGAALDVFASGKPDPQNPLLRMDNVIVSPHSAAFTEESLVRMATTAASGILEVLEGREVSHPVNRPDSFNLFDEIRYFDRRVV